MTDLIVSLGVTAGVVFVGWLLGSQPIVQRTAQIACVILAAVSFPFWAHRLVRQVLEVRRVAPVAAAGHPTALDEEVWANGLTDSELVKRESRFLRLKAKGRLHGQDFARLRAVKRVLAVRVKQSQEDRRYVDEKASEIPTGDTP